MSESVVSTANRTTARISTQDKAPHKRTHFVASTSCRQFVWRTYHMCSDDNNIVSMQINMIRYEIISRKKRKVRNSKEKT